MILGSTPRRWLPLVGAIVAMAIVVAGCGDDTPAATTVAPTATTATTDGAGASTVAPKDDLLDAALANVGTRYAFTATVTLDGAEATRIEGTVYDGVGAYVVTSGGASVEYVVSDQGQWAREAGGDWAVLSGAAPLVDPLDPLTRPLRTRVLDTNGANALVEATYDGATLGFSAGGEVDVTITITDQAVTSISYDAPVGDGIAIVVTTFDGTADVAPIQVPPA